MGLRTKAEQMLEGRNGRLVYWCILAYGLLMLKAVYKVQDMLQYDDGKMSLWDLQIIALLVMVTLPLYAIVAIRRCNDIGINYKILILMILPHFDIVIAILLGFVKKDFFKKFPSSANRRTKKG